MEKPKHLFKPGNIGNLEIKNRIVMAPMCTIAFGPEGELTQSTADYYAARARGGVGLIICQSSIIMWESRAPFRCSVYDDRFIPGLRMVADAIHENGAKAAFQLIHHGRALADYRQMLPSPDDIKPLAPSRVSRLLSTGSAGAPHDQGSPAVATDAPPLEAGKEDLIRIKDAFSAAAGRVREAGFDAVEIMAGHGYLLGQFLSPLYNRRSDDYGGNPENRARFVCEVISAVKDAAGAAFPVILRISASDYLPGGITIQEVVKQIPPFAEAGADAFHVSAGDPSTSHRQYPGFTSPQGANVHLSERIKKVATRPVITVGKIYDPVFADRIVEDGKADFVALGRPLLADPDWANKAGEGRFDDIRPCIYCLNCMNFTAHPYILQHGVTCSVNPAVLREKDFILTPTERPKRVLVVGGGPAGMRAAADLARRGHPVDLYEKSRLLGGQWRIACLQQQKGLDYTRLLTYLEREVLSSGVTLHLGSTVTTSMLAEMRPDVAVVATGAEPLSVDVRGVDGQNVVQGVDVILGRAVAEGKVVVIGGRNLGMELADQLSERQQRVSLVTRRELGRGMEKGTYLSLRDRLVEKGVHLFPYSPVMEINEKGVYIAYNNDLLFLDADTIVLSTGFRPVDNLVSDLKGTIKEVYTVGDCVKPRDLMDAIREGAELARRI